ncbi:type VI secretion system tube protein TssD [Candidatus Eisenbacteria bacterium]|uniref:Type VI secretion system tube protein TssD n=1 Tax=Eiseniibacteriota bacterium TaxID=2212470 RepID=A0ABV6YKU8_UNCEI
MPEEKFQNRARVFVAGQELEDVYECHYTIRTDMARSGLPQKSALTHRIFITRRSDAATPGFTWAHDSKPSNFQSGKIQFYNTAGEVFKTLEWNRGYVVDYEEGVPDLTEAERSTMVEKLEIAAEEFICGDKSVNNHWRLD